MPQVKFRRQVPFGSADVSQPYHADFCSHAKKLIIEVDGDDHALRQELDAARTKRLEREGYRVMRFTNAEVMANIDGVIAAMAVAMNVGKGRP